GIARDARGFAPDLESRALLATLAEQTAAALERSFLAREIAIAQYQAETERVRNILLASVSHDFRTPLASILGSATSLLEYRDRLDDKLQLGLLADIKAEAEGLDEMVRNLLAIVRIDAGALELRRDWVDLGEIAGRVVKTAKRRRASLSFVLDLPAELPMIAVDATLIEQALANVLNNAVSHTPAGTRVLIDAAVTPRSVSLRVTDDGPGIPAEALDRVFEKFVRAGAGTASEANNYMLMTAGTVAESIKRIAADTPDIVVLDLGLPDGDGKDVIRQVRKWSDVPIIVLSARDREAEKIEALDLGSDDFVNKPFGV